MKKTAYILLTIGIGLSLVSCSAVLGGSSGGGGGGTADPIVGLWNFTGGTGSWVPNYEIVAVLGNGTFLAGHLSGTTGSYSQGVSVGTWVKSGSGYAVTSYGSSFSPTQSAPMASTMALSAGNTALSSSGDGGTATFSR